MVCRSCSKEFEDSFAFCPHCGEPTTVETKPEEAPVGDSPEEKAADGFVCGPTLGEEVVKKPEVTVVVQSPEAKDGDKEGCFSGCLTKVMITFVCVWLFLSFLCLVDGPEYVGNVLVDMFGYMEGKEMPLTGEQVAHDLLIQGARKWGWEGVSVSSFSDISRVSKNKWAITATTKGFLNGREKIITERLEVDRSWPEKRRGPAYSIERVATLYYK